MSISSKAAGLAIGLAVLTSIAACGSYQSAPSSEDALSDIPVKRLESYQFDPSVPLIDRVKEAPDFLLAYLHDLYDSRSYTPYMPSETELAEVKINLDLLPPGYLQTLQQRLIGIYFINNWIGSGMSDYVLDSNSEVFTFIIINPETMRHNISDWMTYREGTCFLMGGQEDGGIEITVDCGEEYSGLMYPLLHEASHIMDFVHNFTPYVYDDMEESGLSVPETAFVQSIWTGYDSPAPEAEFSLREDVTFYGKENGPLIHVSEAPALYRDLEKTPFVSLYGSQNWAEDFAEYCTWYYFTSQLHQPYRIILSGDSTIDMIYEPMESDQVQKRTGTPLFD